MLTFTATFGVNEGYGEHVSAPVDRKLVAFGVSDAIAYVLKKHGVVVGCTVTEGRVFYPAEFGCPLDGETVVVVSGAANPKFTNEQGWRVAAIALVQVLKGFLKQSRVTMTFQQAETIYLE